MGCGASVDGDSDSQGSLEEWEKTSKSGGRGKPVERQRSGGSMISQADSYSTTTAGHDRRRVGVDGPGRVINSTKDDRFQEKKIPLVADMIPYPLPTKKLHEIRNTFQDAPSGELFIDSAFPPSENSLFHSQPAYAHQVTWMRPYELISEPQLQIDGLSRQDIIQGVLADCWFLSSCAAVAQKPKLMEKIIPPNQPLYGSGYKGIVIFRFWRFGKWVTVHVDDLLPTRKEKLIYSRSSEPREFWVSLLEKAYAKVHGSYESLEGGQAMDALVDLTGGLAERYELQSPPSHLYAFLLHASRNESFITCSRKGDWKMSTQADANGLVSGHSYTISAVASVKLSTGSEANLVRIRNPWGNDVEWTGLWNDRDNTWKKIDAGTKESIGYTKRGDGEFWMSFPDFCREFEEVTICSTNPDLAGFGNSQEGSEETSVLPIHTISIAGRWEKDKSCGGSRNNLVMFAKNPQFLLMVAKPSNSHTNSKKKEKYPVLIAVMQLRRRCIRHPGRKMLQIGFIVYKVEEPKKQSLQQFINNEELGNSGPYINYREVFARFYLLPGYYIIVPATFEPNCPGSFLIRVFSNVQATIKEL